MNVCVCVITLYMYVGGVCVCPSSMQEALTFFELDTVLSLRQREMICSYAGVSQSQIFIGMII